MVSGNTKVVAIIADPIAHVRTPQAFNDLMQARAVDAVMVPFNVRPQDFDLFMSAIPAIRNLAGLVVTIPYKEIIVEKCTGLTDAARRVGAVNIVRFDSSDPADASGARALIGSNFDGEGFAGGLLAHGHAIRDRRVYLAGAGGAGKAIAHAMAEHGAISIGIYNRSVARAAQLVHELRQVYPVLDVHVADDAPRNYTLAINATSLGLSADDPLPFSPDQLPEDAVVAEAVMKFDVTPLLAHAAERKLAVHFGRHMMDVQLERMARFLGLL